MNLPSSRILSMNLMAAAVVAVLAGSGAFLPVASTKAATMDLEAIAPEFSSPLGAAPDIVESRSAPCAACGIIESTRELESPAGKPDGPAAARREITIRMRDGSMHVFTDANSASWRYGERISIIAGATR